MAIAVSYKKIGYVFMVDGELMGWGLSVKASKSPDNAAKQIKAWIERYEPDILITERLTPHSRKRGRTIKNIEAIEQVCIEADAHHADAIRIQRYNNKYEEIAALCERYPSIADWTPRRPKIWETEPLQTILFEALSLAEEAL